MLPLVLSLLLPAAPAVGDVFNVGLWPGGVVSYRFYQAADDSPTQCEYNQVDFELCRPHKAQVRAMMDVWEQAMRITDPRGRSVSYVRFEQCTLGADCPTSHVVVRYGRRGTHPENNNMCTYFEDGVERVGRNPNGTTTLHFWNVDPGRGPRQGKVQPDTVVLHELGHCLGLWHEQNRADYQRWIQEFETPKACSDNPGECDGNFFDPAILATNLMPILGNYDYDSIMHYPSYAHYKETTDYPAGWELRWADPVGNTFLGDIWQTAFAPARPLQLSVRDISRVLQYQTREHYQGNGFFQSLSISPRDPDLLPNPYLGEAMRVSADGSPAVAYDSPGNYDVFARGGDHCIYWKYFRRWREVVAYVHGKPVFVERNSVSPWQMIGCRFASDPAAVSRGPGLIDIAAVNDYGQVQLMRYMNGNWGAPLTLRGGSPAGGLKSGGNGRYIGPAIAARASNLLDVFVVRDDGRLAVTTWRNGNWEPWQTLGASNYAVSARPAAVALSQYEVRLAINAGDDNLYEPSVVFVANAPGFVLGPWKGTIEFRSPPTVTKQDAWNSRYRVLVTNEHGRVSVRGETSAWRDIGGIPKPGTGPAAVASGDAEFIAVMNGEDATSCTAQFCYPEVVNSGQVIQPGGLWIRHFD